MKIILAVFMVLVLALPVEAKPLQMITFPFSRQAVHRLAKFGFGIVKHTTIESAKWALHVPIILLDGVTSTADLLVYDFKQHVDNVADETHYKYEELKIDGTNVKPKVSPSDWR